MATRSQKVKLGVFLVSAAVLFFAVVVVLTGMGILEKHSTYYIDFTQSVSGLASGMPVKLNGMRVGTVKSLKIAPDNVEVVRVQIQVDEGTPIKTDTVANIDMQGITGLKFIELKESTKQAERLPPGSTIPEGQATLAAIKEHAVDIAATANEVLGNVARLTRAENIERVDAIIANAERATENFDALSAELTQTLRVSREIAENNREAFGKLVDNASEASAKSTELFNEITRLSRVARQIIEDAQIPQTVAEFRDTNAEIQQQLRSMAENGTMERLSAALDQMIVLMRGLSQSVQQNKAQVQQTIDNLQQASESFKDMARSLKAQPSRLFFDNPPKARELP